MFKKSSTPKALNSNNLYDLVVIGGGPAGMLTAGTAAGRGLSVALLEKNDRLGVKLGITGKGRCNLTNSESDLKIWTAKFGPQGKFLFSAFNNFTPAATLRFFTNLGIALKTERGGRVFPKSNSALDIRAALEKWLRASGVEIFYGARVTAWERSADGRLSNAIIATTPVTAPPARPVSFPAPAPAPAKFASRLEATAPQSIPKIFTARNFAICVGGRSYPATGSSGDAYAWLKDWGHTIVEPRPALAPIICAEPWLKDLEGLSLKNVAVKVYVAGKKKSERFGEALFTRDGMSGPIILDISREVGDYLAARKDPSRPISVPAPLPPHPAAPSAPNHNIELSLDFKPALDEKILDARLLRDFAAANKKMLKNSLDELLPQKLIPVILKLWGVNPELPANSLAKDDRRRLLNLLKNFRLTVSGIGNFNQAIVTAGGVALNEIDPRALRSKIVPNLYLAGEILDLDAPTGGYNLQMCWSTGRLLGDSL